MKAAITLEQRIAKYVTKERDGCWLWGGAKTRSGYGHCADGYMHRLVYQSLHGPIPDGLNILHKCDVRNCCNPDHLYVGTQKDNVRDMHERGRANPRPPSGDRHHASKISDEQARHAIAMANDGAKLGDIAKLFSVSTKLIWRVVTGETRKHIQR